MNIQILDTTYRRLQAIAVPFEDTIESVLIRLLDSFEKNRGVSADAIVETRGHAVVQKPSALDRSGLRGFQRDLWELVIAQMPLETFSLADVKAREETLRRRHAHIIAFDEAIRAAMQKLRDKGFLEFLSRGHYRRLVDGAAQDVGSTATNVVERGIASKGIRVNILAKELGIESGAMIEKLRNEGLGDKAPNHMSVLSIGIATSVREWFRKGDGVNKLD